MEPDRAAAGHLVEVPRGTRPVPSPRAIGDDRKWSRWVPAMWQAFADPEGRHLWLGTGEDFWDELGRWAPAVHMLAYSLGWPRIDLGLVRWIGGGRPHLDERLALLDEMLGEGVIELAAWFASGSADYPMIRIASAVRSKLDLPPRHWAGDFQSGRQPGPFGGGGDPLHLSVHTLSAVEPYEGHGVPPVLLRDDSTHRACLVLDAYQGWYRALARETTALAPVRKRQAWTVEVVCRPVGHLGAYRRCPYSGRWFAGPLSLHLLGLAHESPPKNVFIDPSLWPGMDGYDWACEDLDFDDGEGWEEIGDQLLARFLDSRRAT